MNLEISKFYDFLTKHKKIHSCNYIENKKFSKNYFISSKKELIDFAEKNKNKDCYINYNPLKTTINRKNENVQSISVVALDIEFKDKKKPEDIVRINILSQLIRDIFIENHSYMIVESGNGIHVYFPIRPAIKIVDVDVTKLAYYNIMQELQYIINSISKTTYNFSVSCDDRKDLAGILRIPTTMNTSAKRFVKVVEIIEHTNTIQNYQLRKRILYHLRKVKKEIKQNSIIQCEVDNDIYSPKTFDELCSHPVTQMLFDTSLPQVDGWHSTAVFALQALVKFSNIPYYPDIYNLEKQYNALWNTSLTLKSCNADSLYGPLKGAYNFAVKNNFTKYSTKLKKILEVKNEM